MALDSDAWLVDHANLLRSKTFHWSQYTQRSPSWDHDHCHFCYRRFAEPKAGYDDSIEHGYTTPDNFNWICKECFDELKDRFGWIVEALNEN